MNCLPVTSLLDRAETESRPKCSTLIYLCRQTISVTGL